MIAASVGMKIEGVWFEAVVGEVWFLVFFLMAGFAVLFEYGSDESVEVYRFDAADVGLEFRRGALHGQRGGGYVGGFPFVFMAADTCEVLSGMDVGTRAHRLNGHALFIQGLEIDELFYGGLEICAAVGFDGHGAEDDPCGGALGVSHAGLVGDGAGPWLWDVLDYP